jgi:D-alanyl-D-alanine dipeptidase
VKILLVGLGLACLAAASGSAQAQSTRLPQDFVALRDVDPTIRQDMRYAGANNFTGAPLPGYQGAQCILRRATAEALKRVQADLAPRGLSLVVFDCYRPVRAVTAMARWARDGKAPSEKEKRFFPSLEKTRLFSLGYIASRSGHSLGVAIDLSIVDLAQTSTPLNANSTVSCTAPTSERGTSDGLDMGTGFDCFDARSSTASPDISIAQRRNRQTLLNAMTRHGFKNYPREWWHFSFATAGAGSAADFPIP